MRGWVAIAAVLACSGARAEATASETKPARGDAPDAASTATGREAFAGGAVAATGPRSVVAASGAGSREASPATGSREASPANGAGSLAASPATGSREASPANGAGSLAPLPEAVRAAFLAVRADPAPPELIRKSHYWISNEHSHFLWQPRLAGRGGAFLGVGTDQNYLLAGWARPELLLLVDFDGAVVDLHGAYRAAFAAAATPAEFLALWGKDGRAALEAAIDAAHADPDERAAVRRAARVARGLVYKRLARTQREYAARGVPTFLSDPAQYEHLRALWAGGRVFAIRGDLTGDRTLVDLAAALERAEIPIGALYLSNAEQYFDYGPAFRRNILRLPVQADAVVLRTLGWRSHGFVDGETYHYTVQPARKFAAWMRDSSVLRLGRLLRHKTATAVPGSSAIEADPVVSRVPPEIAP
jgi:hypothetical protein